MGSQSVTQHRCIQSLKELLSAHLRRNQGSTRETLKAVVEGPGPQMLVEILLGMTLSVGHGEISATLDMVAEEHGLTFAARSKEPHPKFEGKIKWGARRGEIFRTFDQIEKMMGGCLKPSKEQRAQFREMLRKEVMEPLRERYNLLKPEFRELQMLVTKPPTEEVKQDKHPPRPAGTNGATHHRDASVG